MNNPPKRATLPSARRLRGFGVFSRIFAARCSVAHRLMVTYVLPNDLPYSRLGIVIGRKYGTAVARNRIKRLMREAFRMESIKVPAGFDYLFVPKPGVLAALEECRRAVCDSAVRAVQRYRRSVR